MPSTSDLALMRVNPTFSSLLGPSKTSTISFSSAFFNVFDFPVSKKSVRAICFTTT